MRMDREYTACRFVVVGLELARQAGQFDVTGVAALAVQGEDWAPQWRVHARVGPAPQSPSAPGSERSSVVWVESAADALAVVERRLTADPHVVVARLGQVEAGIFRVHRASCPRLASQVIWDALRLAQIACPSVAEPSESALASALGVELPDRQAPLTQAVWATSEICRRAVAQGVTAGRWATLRQIEDLVGKRQPPVEAEYLPTAPVQGTLFDG
ncbi:hypothetical protein ABT173_25535 [Streptomyces sp. NPDC001795]|uniref:hypothetical protein n=1 Tax=Streptomyces sp. NPDC001795 TaxID=3154525 RepID=UPI003317CE1A